MRNDYYVVDMPSVHLIIMYVCHLHLMAGGFFMPHCCEVSGICAIRVDANYTLVLVEVLCKSSVRL